MSQREEKKEKKKKWPFILIAIVLLITGFLLYSRYSSTSGLKVKEYKVTSTSLPSSFHGLKIVHLSDIHYGTTIQKKELEKVVNEVNLLKPDIVVLTGDLFDREKAVSKKELIEVLSKIEVTIKKYAILGNHDYAHLEWEEVIKKSGFENLNNTYDLVYQKGYDPILIAGISSNILGLNLEDKTKALRDYLSSLSVTDGTTPKVNPKYRILIMHEPDYIDELGKEEFNLVLAGHSHNGQVRLPFVGATILPKAGKKYYEEHYTFDKTELYVSSGLGTTGIPFRFLNKPSINLYRLTTK